LPPNSRLGFRFRPVRLSSNLLTRSIMLRNSATSRAIATRSTNFPWTFGVSIFSCSSSLPTRASISPNRANSRNRANSSNRPTPPFTLLRDPDKLYSESMPKIPLLILNVNPVPTVSCRVVGVDQSKKRKWFYYVSRAELHTITGSTCPSRN